MDYLLLFIALFALSTTYLIIALKRGIVDKPNQRSSHTNETVRGGGIIFPVSALAWFIYSQFQFPLLFTGLVLISIVSFWDDVSPVSPTLRLAVHLGAIVLLYIELQLFQLPWWSWLPAIIIAAGIINAYNFMDGINGMTSGYSLAQLTGIWIVNNYQFHFISNELIYFLIISVVVFSYFNFRTKAKYFAGDVGSISIAYLVFFLLAKLISESGNWLYILFFSIYAIDTGFTLLQRIIRKENIFEAHRQHIYQQLTNELKISHLKVAALYTILQLIICFIIIVFSGNNFSFLTSIITGASILGIMVFIFHWIKSQINQKVISLK